MVSHNITFIGNKGSNAKKIFPIPLHDRHQPEPLIHCRMDPYFDVVYTKFSPYHLNVTTDIAVRFIVLYIQRCSSEYLSCKVCLFEQLLPFYQLQTVWIFFFDHQQEIATHRIATHWNFFFNFWPFSVKPVKPRDGYVKNPSRSATLQSQLNHFSFSY